MSSAILGWVDVHTPLPTNSADVASANRPSLRLSCLARCSLWGAGTSDRDFLRRQEHVTRTKLIKRRVGSGDAGHRQPTQCSAGVLRYVRTLLSRHIPYLAPKCRVIKFVKDPLDSSLHMFGCSFFVPRCKVFVALSLSASGLASVHGTRERRACLVLCSRGVGVKMSAPITAATRQTRPVLGSLGAHTQKAQAWVAENVGERRARKSVV